MGTLPLETGLGYLQGLAVTVGHKQVAGRPALIQRRLGLRLGEPRVQHGFAVPLQARLQCFEGLNANHDGPTDFSHADSRGFADAGANQRRMGLLIRTRPQQRKFYVPRCAPVRKVLGCPRLHQQLLGLIQPRDAFLHREAKTHILIVVVRGAAPQPDNQPPVAKVVQQRGLHRQPHGMVEGQFNHGKTNFQMRGARGHGGPQYQRISVGGGAVEVVLGEPYRMHTNLFGEHNLVQRAVNHRRVVFRMVANREYERTEPHNRLNKYQVSWITP